MKCRQFGALRCLGLERAPESKVTHKTEQPHAPAGVDKDDILALFEQAPANQIHQARHALTGVNRIKQDAFQTCEHLNGIEGAGRAATIPLADVVAVRYDIFATHRTWRTAG